MNSNDIIKKMVKTVSVIRMSDVDHQKMARELITCCTEDGTHLVEVDREGCCTSCGYKETIKDFKS